MSDKKRKWRVTRRGFLIGLGATGLGLALGVKVGTPIVRLRIAEMFDGPAGSSFGGVEAPPTTWFEISPDNRVRLHLPKVEMGQGVHTSLAQIAAEELEIEWDQLDVVQVGTGQGLDDSSGTGGSTSVSALYVPLREAGATLREMLRAEAAKHFGASPSELVAENGTFYVQNAPDNKVTYGELAQQAPSWEVPEEAPPLKPASEFRYIGQPMKRVDLFAKITAQAVYGYDARMPNMLYGAVARPPTINGKLRRAAAGDAASKPGVVKVVIEDDFAGVVAESRAQAYAGVSALELEWDEGDELQQADIESMVTIGKGKGVVIQEEGDSANNLAEGAIMTAEYRTPMAAHAHLEPQAGLVDVQADKVIAYISTQMPVAMGQQLADALGRDVESVYVTPTYLGGGFGRKLGSEAGIEAARLSAAVERPVHVGWNRTEDMRHGYFRPPTHHKFQATLDANGKIVALQQDQASGDVAFDFVPGFMATVMGADFGAWRGTRIQYAIPNMITTAWRTQIPIRTGWWRGLGLLANTFAVESFIDELAHATGADPLQFRLQHMPDSDRGQRFKQVLATAAERAGWDTPAPEGRARGIACSVDVDTVVAQVAEVSVEEGQIRVHKVVSAVDPGLVINPDGAKAQTEGSIVMGLSSTFFERITIKNGQVEAANFDRYPLITIKETPDIEVVLLESDGIPRGMGEPPIGPIAAAVANATFALTGQRLRELPLKLA
ncbi:MAG: molybdopterin cofactor-binding domain-containing protein [Ardenticatenaceae bacterium]